MSYQIVLIEPGGTALSQGFRDALSKQVEDLGLDPASTLDYFDATSVSRLNPKFPAAGVYFGSEPPTQAATDAVAELMAASAFILPVVTDITRYAAWTPPALHPINGTPLDAQAPRFDPLADEVLKALRLIRARRQVFISYMRRESRGVAFQLFYALRDRGFEAFLDTHSVGKGLRFQDELWDRMNDSDLILLLDTENARSSRWVADEIAQAKLMGLGIYQLIWPGVTRSRETDICQPHYLEPDAFVAAEADAEALRLTPEAVGAILHQLERYRARSFSARRTRLINTLKSLADEAGLTTCLTGPGRIEVVGAGGQTYALFPVIGHLHSNQIHDETRSAEERDPKTDTVSPKDRRLLYDDLGIRPLRKQHLDWLNSRLHDSVQNMALEEAKQWIKNVS